MYLSKQKFFVLGLSKSGKAAAQFLLAQGASVYVYDDVISERVDKTAQELIQNGAKRITKEQI